MHEIGNTTRDCVSNALVPQVCLIRTVSRTTDGTKCTIMANSLGLIYERGSRNLVGQAVEAIN